jgi:hypothetical protein
MDDSKRFMFRESEISHLEEEKRLQRPQPEICRGKMYFITWTVCAIESSDEKRLRTSGVGISINLESVNRTPIRHSGVQTVLCFYGGVFSMDVPSPKRKYRISCRPRVLCCGSRPIGS